jgi:hypothetical protein
LVDTLEFVAAEIWSRWRGGKGSRQHGRIGIAIAKRAWARRPCVGAGPALTWSLARSAPQPGRAAVGGTAARAGSADGLHA